MLTDIKDIHQAKLEAESSINETLRAFSENTGLNIVDIEVDIVAHSNYSDNTVLNFVGVSLEVRL